MAAWPTKKLEEIKKAWLVQWGYCGQNEDECLKQAGIEEMIVDVIGVRKSFEDIVEIAKNIYQCKMLSLSEKVFLSNYLKGEERRKDFFGRTVPVFTHYQSDLYRNLIKTIEEKGVNSVEADELRNKWIKYPQYIIVGHNPHLEIRKVFNLSVYRVEDGNEVMVSLGRWRGKKRKI